MRSWVLIPTLPELHRIVVRATNWLGDAVMSLPALRAIRGRYPDAHIAVLALDSIAGIYAREAVVNEVIPYNAQRGMRDWSGKRRLAREIQERNFDAAILFQNAFEAAFITWMARLPIRAGYDRDGRGILLTHAVPVPEKGSIPPHESFYYLEMLRQLGVAGPLPGEAFIRLDGAGEASKSGRDLLARAGMVGDVVGVSPGAAYGNAKRWLPERFAEAAVTVARAKGWAVVLFGSKGERELCEEVAGHVSAAGVAVHNFAGETSLREFIDLAAACRLMLTNDSGAMHIASALGVPTVTVFGATDHIGTGPTGPLARIVRESIECSPCLKRECPLGHHRCMQMVTAERVAETGLELLQIKT